jgi:hypothetical protein
VLDRPRKVTVVVKRPADAEFPDLAATLQRRPAERVDRPVPVEVEFRDATTARPAATGGRVGPAGAADGTTDATTRPANLMSFPR